MREIIENIIEFFLQILIMVVAAWAVFMLVGLPMIWIVDKLFLQ